MMLESHFSHDFFDDETEDEPEHYLDFTFDGEPGGGRTQTRRRPRRKVVELRILVDQVRAGNDTRQLELKMQAVTSSVNRAVEQCLKLAARNPDQSEFFHTNCEAYDEALDALRLMDNALASSNSYQLDQAMQSFERAAGWVDELVLQEKDATR